MDGAPAPLTGLPDTVGTLRAMFRDAEARGTRLRLLLETARDLAEAAPEGLDAVLSLAAQRGAVFMGRTRGRVIRDADAFVGRALSAPGPQGRIVGRLVFEPADGEASVGDDDPEDGRGLEVLMQGMGAAIDRVERDRDRAALLALLRDREARLERVLDRLFTSQEDERRRVSQDLHDGVAQLAGALFRQIEACAHDLEPQDRAKLEPATHTSLTLMRELRAVISGLRPTALDDLGLATAVKALAEPLIADGFEVTLTLAVQDRWPDLVETAMYRVAQEALANVRKHAGPTAVVLSLETLPDGYRLRVRDEGRGFAPVPPGDGSAEPGYGIGLQVMEERMTVLGGSLGVTSAPGGGTQITAEIPREMPR